MNERTEVVRQFEDLIADYAGALYGVAVESCSAALLLSCLYCKVKEVTIPRHTYFSVPCSIIHAGGTVAFEDRPWTGAYQLKPYPIWDSAVRFKERMYMPGTFYCLSFQSSKHVPIGRGGMILTNDPAAKRWFERMRNDGRGQCPKEQDDPRDIMLGYNMYMTPEQAARGIDLFYWRIYGKTDLPDICRPYSDLSLVPAYTAKKGAHS